MTTDFGILLALGYQGFVSRLHEDLAGHGYDDLARSDGYVFRALAVEPLTTSALASRLGVTKQGAAQIVDDMTRRGYLTSRPHPHDARARLQELSERGRGELTAARAFHRRYESISPARQCLDKARTFRRVAQNLANLGNRRV